MKKFIFILIFIGINLILIICNYDIYAQQNNFKTYSIEDGLPQSTVYAIYNDTRGYLWLGTDGGGISRFDGINFTNYGKKNGLAGNTIRSIIEDKKGNLWFGTDEGISVYDGYKFITIDSAKGLSKNVIIKLFCDKDGNIWAGTSGGGINKININKDGKFIIETYTSQNGLSNDIIFDICQDSFNNLWIATLGGGINILSYKDNRIKIFKLNNLIPSQYILSVKPDKQGNIWVGTYDAGVFFVNKTNDFNKISIKSFNNSNRLNDNTIWNILVDKTGDIWFATNSGGINRFSGNKTEAYTEQQGFPNNQVVSAYQDNEGNIWFGTMGSGLCKFMGDNFAHFTTKDGINNNIFAIIQDKKRNYWLASNGSGLTKMTLENNKLICKNYTTSDGLNDNCIKSLAIDLQGNIWIGSAKNGICKFNGNSFTIFTESEGLSNNNVNCVFVDSKGVLWCGTEGGISKFYNNEFFIINQENYKLINNEVQTIIEDKSGCIWAGTLGGLVKLCKNEMTDFNQVDGLDEKKIYSLAADKSGNIWIGTFGGGLYKYEINSTDKKPIHLVIDDTKLSSNNIYSLIFQDENTLIVGTDKGVDKLFLDKTGKVSKIFNYDKTNGFLGIENNLNAICKDNDKNIWFGTVKGITRYNPSKEYLINEPPITHITGLDLFFEKIDWSKKAKSVTPWFNLPNNLVLKYSDNHLAFYFTGISLKNPQKVYYRYKLEGLDNNWSPPLKQIEVVYSGLAPGNYTFKVIARNENGIWNPIPQTFSFTITPPFWKTWWFYLIICIVSLGILIFFIKYRERKLKKEKAILEQKVEERTKEIKEQKEVIEEKNRDIMASIKYAQRIQDAILPPGKIVKQFVEDSFILYKPKDIVSGDFYWIEPKQNYIYFSAVDCTGHGVPGAFMSIVGHNGLNRALREYGLLRPSEILDKLNDIVAETLRQTENSNVKDGMDLALCAINKNTFQLEYAGANNPLYIVRKTNVLNTSDNQKIETDISSNGFYLFEIKGNAQPIGAFEHRQNFTNHSFQLEKGDTIYVFSDGYADQFGGAKGKKFKYKPFKELLVSFQNLSLSEQKDVLDITNNEWRGNLEQIDDICIIGVKL